MSNLVTISKLYGASWCADCKRSRDFLDSKNITYNYVDIDQDPEAVNEVAKINHGLKSIPTIIFSNGEVLVEPSNAELAKMLGIEVN